MSAASAAHKRPGVSRDLAAGGIHSRRGCEVTHGSPAKTRFRRVQVSIPIDQLKDYIAERVAF